MYKAVFIVSLLLLSGVAAHAQFYAFGGYSYTHADLNSAGSTSLNGWDGSIEGKVLPLLGLVADFSGGYGSPNIGFDGNSSTSVSLHQYNFLFGPQVSFSVSKIRPFAHVLLGASHLSESALGASTSDNAFAYAIGGGLDYHLVPMFAWRVQADYLQTRFNSTSQNDVRIATGLVFHF
ncbi:MAG TPA: outer membrane beta-barrel protein [Terriglobales bacterium]